MIAFDPAVLEVRRISGGTLLGRCGETRPDNTLLVCQDNLAGNANSAGLLLFSAFTSVSPAPTPALVIGDEKLAGLTFRAKRRGRSSIDFHVLSRPSPGTGSYSQVVSGTDPSAAAGVTFEPDLPDQAFIEVVRR